MRTSGADGQAVRSAIEHNDRAQEEITGPEDARCASQKVKTQLTKESPTAEVFGEPHITPSTVRDQFKSIFDKVGVRSRRELVGQVFAQQYQPRMATGHEPDADGWFTRAAGTEAP